MVKSNSFNSNLQTSHSSLANMVEQLTDWETSLEDSTWGHRLTVEALKLNMPVELQVEVGDKGDIIFKGSAPTQTVKTTVMPVFHRMRLHLAVDEEDLP